MNPLVSPAWLAARLQNPNTVILDATLPPVGVTPPIDTRARYLAQHLPGAVFFDIEDLSDHATTLPHMLPSAEAFSRAMSQLGVGDSMTIVVYEQEGVFSAPRAWWMLRTMGAQTVHLLDGGLAAWLAAGLPTESGPVQRPEASFHAKLDANAVRSYGQIQQALSPRVAKSWMPAQRGRFAGTAPGSRGPASAPATCPGVSACPSLSWSKRVA